MSLVTSSFSNVWLKKNKIISSGATEVIDSVPQLTTTSLDYYIIIEGVGSNDRRSFNMKVQRETSTTTSDSVYGKLGSGVNYEVSSAIVSSNIEVYVKNNEANNIEVSIARLKL